METRSILAEIMVVLMVFSFIPTIGATESVGTTANNELTTVVYKGTIDKLITAENNVFVRILKDDGGVAGDEGELVLSSEERRILRVGDRVEVTEKRNEEGELIEYMINKIKIAKNCDILPGKFPNFLLLDDNESVKVVVPGAQDLNVTEIEIEIVQMELVGSPNVTVKPKNLTFEDTIIPSFGGDGCDGNELGEDGIIDLVLEFDSQEIITEFDLEGKVGKNVPLLVEGNLKEEFNSTPFECRVFITPKLPSDVPTASPFLIAGVLGVGIVLFLRRKQK